MDVLTKLISFRVDYRGKEVESAQHYTALLDQLRAQLAAERALREAMEEPEPTPTDAEP
jgi:hypothetical protein